MTAALHTLFEHAQTQRDQGLMALQQAEAEAQRLQQQAEQLLAYRDDYRRRHPAQDGRSASIELLRCHQGFMERLDQALAQQQAQVQAAQARAVTRRSELVALETRVAAVRKLQERRGAERQRHADRLDQRRSDEAAAQQWVRAAQAAALQP